MRIYHGMEYINSKGGILMHEHYPFTVKPLPYDYNALEPYIDEKTMHLYHDGHYRGYVDGLNKALKDFPEFHHIPLPDLLENLSILPLNIRNSIRNNGGGVFNHELFFQIMRPVRQNEPTGKLAQAINRHFGSYDNFKNKFKEAALNRFGSGWAWLVNDDNGNLYIITTPNQDTPLHAGINPILPLDVWEHAYYLKYHNRRGDYIDNWFNVIDWNKISDHYQKSFILK